MDADLSSGISGTSSWTEMSRRTGVAPALRGFTVTGSFLSLLRPRSGASAVSHSTFYSSTCICEYAKNAQKNYAILTILASGVFLHLRKEVCYSEYSRIMSILPSGQHGRDSGSRTSLSEKFGKVVRTEHTADQ